MERELASLNTDDLVAMYHKINAELARQFINRASFDEQQERISSLSSISRELSKRADANTQSVRFEGEDERMN